MLLRRWYTGVQLPSRPSMEGQKTLPKLKKDLDTVFSKYIRLRDSENGYGHCFTCLKLLQWKEGHCGHFIPRNVLNTRWNEDNCRLQCVGCNLYGNGKVFDFEENLLKQIGEDAVSTLKHMRNQPLKVNRAWYEEMIELYKLKVKELEGYEHTATADKEHRI